MSTLTTKDGTSIYYKDWGTGQPLVFSHGWPLSADAWDAQMLFFAQNGYRAIAHDRRGHGRSSQPWNGYTMDTYADDLEELLAHLNVKGALLVGHSMGGGEVARYISRHGLGRLSKAALISAVPPLMLRTESNPGGQPLAAFDGIRAALKTNRAQFFKDAAVLFHGYNRPDAKLSQGILDSFWHQGMTASIVGVYECVKQFSETDFTGDLKKMNLPTLVIHGDDDQIVPITDSSLLTVKLLKQPTLKVYPGASHGLCATHPDQVNADLLEFLKS